MGYLAGNTSQTTQAIAVGSEAGYTTQGTEAIAIGHNAGNASQSSYGVAIGSFSGSISQATKAVAVGGGAGYTTQGTEAIAIGFEAGNSSQGSGAIAIGYQAGYATQSLKSIAIGYQSQAVGSFSTCIGYGCTAGQSCVVLCGGNSGVSSPAIDSTCIAPLRVQPNLAADAATSYTPLYYNNTTKELVKQGTIISQTINGTVTALVDVYDKGIYTLLARSAGAPDGTYGYYYIEASQNGIAVINGGNIGLYYSYPSAGIARISVNSLNAVSYTMTFLITRLL